MGELVNCYTYKELNMSERVCRDVGLDNVEIVNGTW